MTKEKTTNANDDGIINGKYGDWIKYGDQSILEIFGPGFLSSAICHLVLSTNCDWGSGLVADQPPSTIRVWPVI